MKRLSLIFLCFVIFSAGYMRATEDLDTLFRRAHDFYMADNYEQAINCYKKCLKFVPNNKTILYNMGHLYHDEMGEFDAAQEIFENLYLFDSSDERIRTKLRQIYLRNRDWGKGAHFINQEDLWWHDEDIKGKTVLLYYADWHGLGDVINFVRYAKRLSGAGAEVIVQTFDRLNSLLSSCPFIKKVISLQDQPPAVDRIYKGTPVLQMLMDLQKLLSDVPYLYADEQLVKNWKEKLSVDKNFKVGICWQSNLCRHKNGEVGPNIRSVPFEKLEKLKDIPGVNFYSLQKFNGKKDLQNKSADFIVHEFDESFDVSHGRMMDTAAVMKNLDLVITVDTSLAHLAGALGVPVWTMLLKNSDWRWLRDRTDSPWYPTMRLFRQKKLGDWDGVMDEVASALQDMVSKRGIRK